MRTKDLISRNKVSGLFASLFTLTSPFNLAFAPNKKKHFQNTFKMNREK